MSIQISGDQIKNNAVPAGKLDLSSGTFDFSSATIRAASPSADSDVAIKSYVDSLAASGVYWKESCNVATTAPVTLSSAIVAGQSLDGVTLGANMRVLVKDQTGDSAPENGIYIVAASGAPSRASDMNSSDEFSGSAVFVEQGSVNADQGYICTNNGPVTVGTTDIAFTQFTGLGQITAGAGLSKSNNTLSVSVDDASIEIQSNELRIKSSGVSNAMLAGSIANSKLQNSTISGVALGSNLNALSKATNGGVNFTSYNGSSAVADLQLDISDLAVVSVDVGADSFAFYDQSGEGTGKATIASLMTATAGAALSASSGVLAVSVDNSSIEVNGDALRVKAAGITNSMLANSTISGVALGSNLGSLSKATNGGVSFTPYNGSASTGDLALDINDLAAATINVAADSFAFYDADASITGKESIADLMTAVAGDGIQAQSGVLKVGVDDSSVEISGDALRVKAGGVTNNMLNGGIQTSKLQLQTQITQLTPNGSTTSFDLDHALTNNTELILVFRNGICIQQVDSSPSGTDQFVISVTGGTDGKALITFGSAPASGDDLKAFYVI